MRSFLSSYPLIAAIVGAFAFLLLGMVVTDIGTKLGLWAIGVGIFGLGIGWAAIKISSDSDAKMSALANHAFDEKAAMMEQYEDFFRENYTGVKFERFRWDLEAISHVAKWADQEKRDRVARSVETIEKAVRLHVTKDSMDKILALADKIQRATR